MLKKKAVVFGLIGTIVAGFGFAGCAETQSSVGDVETTEIVDTVATVANGGESGAVDNGGTVANGGEPGASENEAKPAEGTGNGGDSGVKEADGKYVYTILNGQLEVPLHTDVYKYVEKIDGFEYYDIFTLAKDLGWEPTSLPELQEQKVSWCYTYSSDGYDMDIVLYKNRHSESTEAMQTACYGFDISGLRGGEGRDISIENYYGSKYRTRMDHSISIDHAVLLAYSFEQLKEHPGIDPMYDLLKDTPLYKEIHNSWLYNFEKLL